MGNRLKFKKKTKIIFFSPRHSFIHWKQIVAVCKRALKNQKVIMPRAERVSPLLAWVNKLVRIKRTINISLIFFLLKYSVAFTSLLPSGGSAAILWTPWPVVWREWPGRWQKLNLSWCGRIGDRLQRHLCWQSRQLHDPAPWLCKHASVEWSDLQRPLLSGCAMSGVYVSLFLFCPVSTNCVKPSCLLYSILSFPSSGVHPDPGSPQPPFIHQQRWIP